MESETTKRGRKKRKESEGSKIRRKKGKKGQREREIGKERWDAGKTRKEENGGVKGREIVAKF